MALPSQTLSLIEPTAPILYDVHTLTTPSIRVVVPTGPVGAAAVLGGAVLLSMLEGGRLVYGHGLFPEAMEYFFPSLQLQALPELFGSCGSSLRWGRRVSRAHERSEPCRKGGPYNGRQKGAEALLVVFDVVPEPVGMVVIPDAQIPENDVSAT